MKKILLSLSLLLAISFSSKSQTYLNEDFTTFIDSIAPPLASGWKNIDSSVAQINQVWRFDNPTPLGLTAPIAGKAAILDSDWYGAGNTQDAYLTSPNFDASLATVVTLEFDQWHRQLANTADVEVFDGLNWVVVASYGTINTPNPEHVVIDISTQAAGVSNCQIRFHYGGSYDWWWMIDNINVFQPVPDDLSAISVDNLLTGCTLDSVPVSATIVNVGSTTINSFPINFRVNGGQLTTETYTGTMLAGDTVRYTFTKQAIVSTPNTYNIEVYTTLRNDNNFVNDTTSGIALHQQSISTFPYNEGFELNAGDWTTYGTNSSWAWGAPAGITISGAASGTNAWVTNLNGDYNNSEVSYLESPCIDFTSLTADPILYFSHTYITEPCCDEGWVEISTDAGVTWTKVLDNGGALEWYNDLGNQWWDGNSSAGPGLWVNAQNRLIGAAGQAFVKIRFAFSSDGSVVEEGFAVDNIRLSLPPAVDVGVFALTSPGTNCSFGTSDTVCIQVINYGSAAISNVPVAYSFNNGAAVTDTVRNTINPGDTSNFCFTTGAVNLSAPGNYSFNIYTDEPTDGLNLNDSIQVTVTNNLITAPTTENFDGFALGGNLINGWTNTSTGPGAFSYNWYVNSGQTGSGATGPSGDNTTGSANYIYTEASNGAPGDVATLTSPCIDVSAFNGATLEFYYHMLGGQINTLYIMVQNGNGLFIVDSIVGAQQTAIADPFIKRSINITNYISAGNISVSFQSVSLGCCAGDISIDDFSVFEPTPSDASMLEVVSPETGCGLSSSDSIKVRVINAGTATLDTIPVAYSINNGPLIIDTLFISLAPGVDTIFTFSQPANFAANGNYSLLAYTDLANDGNRTDDSTLTTISNNTVIAPITENFDAFTIGGNLINGWTNSGNAFVYDWYINSGQTGSGGTGPNGDNTSGSGNYIYTEASNGQAGNVAMLTSPCIDASGLTGATLEFYYHMLGLQINTLYVYLDNDNGQFLIDSIVGAQQLAITDPFLQRSINVTSYLGAGKISISFMSVSLGCCAGDIAIDDFRFYEPSNSDAGVVSIDSPITNCGLTSSNTVCVKVVNFGLAALDTIPVAYSLNLATPVIDTIFTTVQPGDTAFFCFAIPVNLSAVGVYDIMAYTNLAVDGDNNNDSASATVENIPIVTFPYTEDFETTSGGWIVSGTNSSWAWGLPTGLYIPAASSGIGAWITNLNGQYNNSEFSYLTSPCIDLSGATSDPNIYFDYIFEVEQCCDEAWLEMSVNGGQTWTKVLANNAQNWYNDLANQWWDTNNISGSAVWDTAFTTLTGAAGQSNFRLRFVMSTDASVTREGFGFDNVKIDFTIGVNEEARELERLFSISPNPSNGQFIITYEDLPSSTTIEIRDVKGQLVYENQLSNSSNGREQIDLSSQSKGVYFIKVNTNEKSFVEKVIIQ